ncbi:MAG: ATP-binding protein [Gloeotrichia echinulata IR180]|nr:ATP-binding protein [Gloeotrichia echinulata DEX184]
MQHAKYGRADAIIKVSEQDLKKVVQEIVDNAFKFSQFGHQVRLISNTNDHFLTLYIINNGRGMTAAQISHIGAYMQFDRKLYEQQGSGLGLIIAKRITELYGGEFFIKSIPNIQTIVRMTFPAWS